MATFQKPENALKRAEELIDVGKKQDALDTLHAAIQHRKFRNLWTTTIEDIMVRHLQLCVELKKMRTAREGLYQYRTMCQAANIGSLEHVVQKFRKCAEEKVSQAQQLQDTQMADMGDLDEMESPEKVLVRAIQAQDTRQQSQDGDVHMHFRFLWDTYKVVLDVLKSNVRLEEVYHETARHAFEFCRANQRPQEFKRLCDTLRRNYTDLFKGGGKVPAHQVNPNSPDTIMRTLETRCKQLQISTELDLWGGAYLTATEIFELMSKGRPKPHLRSMYYEYLAQIFWKSENHLFHAFACLKNLMFVKAAKQNITKDELQLLASKAVLSTLCVPFSKTSDIHATLELTTEGASSPYEKAKKHAQLFNVQTVPTRDSISQSLVEKCLLPLAAEPCKKLFALIESDFTPLSLCQDAKPILDELALGELFDGKLVPYITPLKQIIFFRLMKQLSEVYANMTIDNFERAASIVPFSVAEKWMANAARQHGINIQINYSHKAIVFGAPRKVNMKSMRQPLIEIGMKLQQAMQRVAPEEQHKKEKQEKQQLSQNIVRRIEEETKLIRQRKEEIERRKEQSEKRKDIAEREAAAKQRKQEEKEAEAERIRLEEERIKRDREREEQRKREQEMVKNRAMLEEMKKQADLSKGSNLKIEGKKIAEIVAEDLTKLDPLKIMKAREAQMKRERQEKIRQRKLESKRVDHLARALREDEKDYLEEWAQDVEDQDSAFLEKAEEKNMEEQKVKHGEALKERDALMPYKRGSEEWCDKLLSERRAEYEELAEKREQRLTKQVVQLKIDRARERLKKNKQDAEDNEKAATAEKERLHKQREEEERRRREEEEEEERRRDDEEEAERLAEEKKKKLEAAKKRREEEEEQRGRADEKRKQREQEIEERQRAEAEADKSKRERDREAPRRVPARDEDRKKDDDDGDNWRSAKRSDTGAGDSRRGPAWGRDREGDRDRRDDDRDRRDDRGPPSRGAWGRDGDRDRRDDDRDRRDDEDRRPMGRDNDREGWRSKGRAPDESGGGDTWRRPAAPAKSEDKDDWRSAGGPPARGGSTRTLDDRDRDRDRDDGDKGGSAWGRRPAARDEKKEEQPSAWRRPAAADKEKEDAGPWRRNKEPEDATPSRRPPAKEEPKPEPRSAPAPAPEPAAPEEEDDGFSTVVKGKKKGAKPKEAAEEKPSAWGRGAPGGAARGGDAGERRPTPPWKRK